MTHPATLIDCLSAAAHKPGGVTFVNLQEHEQFYSWGEIEQRARRVAAALIAKGICPGERIAIVLSTCPEFLDIYFGTLLAGAIPVPLSPPLRLGKLDAYHQSTARMLSAVGARVVVTDERIKRLLGMTILLARPPLGCLCMQDFQLTAPLTTAVRRSSQDIALIQFSSGSTVDPKPVALSHANLIAQLAMIEAMLPACRRGVSWLPLHHDMGLIGCLLSGIYNGGSLVLIPPEYFLARPALWLRAISRHRAAVSPAPSFAYALCLKRIRDEELENIDLSSWSLALNGAEPVSVGTLDAFAERFGRWGFDAQAFAPVYGLAEATLAITASPRGRTPQSVAIDAEVLAKTRQVQSGTRRLASVGRVIDGIQLQIRDEQGQVLGDSQQGTIWVRAPSVMRGYYNNPEATAATLVEGWLNTGDLGFMLEGELYVCGRAKDLVIIRGANHAPHEFEECLEGIVGLRQGCAVALGFVPSESENEELLILAEHSSDDTHPNLQQAIESAVLSRTGIRPHTVRILAPGTLPRTTSGKLRRSEALRQFLAGELQAPKSVTRLRIAGAMVQSSVAFARLRVSHESRA